MALDSNALSLSEYAVMSNSPWVTSITKSLLINGNIMADIPFINRRLLNLAGVRWEATGLPTVTWNKINGGTTVTKGKPTPYAEQAFLVRNSLDTDIKLIMEETAIVDPRQAQLNAYFASFSYDFNDKFINNDHLSGDDDSVVGLRYRIDNPTVYGVASELKIDAGGVDLSDGGMTAANANKFIRYMQTMLDYFGRREGDGVVFYMNADLIRRLEQAVRLLGAGAGFNTQVDSWGRMVTKYRNARIVDIGRKSDNSTQIITSTETSAGAAGASNYTSVYGVVYGEDRFVGWQYESLPDSVRDIGLIGNDGTAYRIQVDYACGFFPQHTRCIGRIYDIKVS